MRAAGRLRRPAATPTRSSRPTAGRSTSSPRPTASRTSTATDLARRRQPTRVTNVLSGVSGITPLTPALSVAAARAAGRLHGVRGRPYNIYATDTTGSRRQRRRRHRPRRGGPAAVDRAGGRGGGSCWRRRPAGLPPRADVSANEDYKRELSLDAVGQPTVGVGADRFGAYAAGGMSFLWSDMLGNHQLGHDVPADQPLRGNRRRRRRTSTATHRWNWGIVGEQTPYVTGSFAQGFDRGRTGDGVRRAGRSASRQINRASPGSRSIRSAARSASSSAAGSGASASTSEIETRFFSPVTGQLIDERTEELPRPTRSTSAKASAALVYDTSVFGATSPILGQRYRLEYVAGRRARCIYSGVLADYRQYFMPARPFTFALRGLHYGRYGRDGEDARLSPLYLGYPGLVRGYEMNSFDANECPARRHCSCAAFDQLVGSRMLSASAELRVPAARPVQPRACTARLPRGGRRSSPTPASRGRGDKPASSAASATGRAASARPSGSTRSATRSWSWITSDRSIARVAAGCGSSI